MAVVATMIVTPGLVTGVSALGAPKSDSVTTETVAIAPAAAQAAAAAGDDNELVVNGGFEQGVTAWRVNNANSTKLATSSDAQSGNGAASLTAVTAGTLVLNDNTNTVSETAAGETFEVSAQVKSSRPGATATLRIREVLANSTVRTSTAQVKLGSTWQRAALSYTATARGSHLDLNVIGWQARKGDVLKVDAVSMRRTTPAPTTGSSTTQPGTSTTTSTTTSTRPPTTTTSTWTPTTTGTWTPTGTTSTTSTPTWTSTTGQPTTSTTRPPTTTSSTTRPPTTTSTSTTRPPTTNPPVSGCLTARGIPVCGGPFVGSAITGNGDPAAKERTYGTNLGVRRTFYNSNQIDGAVRIAKADVAAGRLPWISFKAPYSWAEMVNGKGDAWAAELAAALKTVDGPVWVAIHHEPETEGDVRVWAQMQKRLSPIIRNGAPNVAYTIIVMGYHQIFGNDPALSFDAIWPGDGLVDVIGIDPYNRYGTGAGKEFRELKDFYVELKAFADKHGARWGVAETGYTHEAAAMDSAWLNRAVSDMEAMGGVALSYFDSTLNSDADWTLSTTQKVNAFSSALRETNRIN